MALTPNDKNGGFLRNTPLACRSKHRDFLRRFRTGPGSIARAAAPEQGNCGCHLGITARQEHGNKLQRPLDVPGVLELSAVALYPRYLNTHSDFNTISIRLMETGRRFWTIQPISARLPRCGN